MIVVSFVRLLCRRLTGFCSPKWLKRGIWDGFLDFPNFPTNFHAVALSNGQTSKLILPILIPEQLKPLLPKITKKKQYTQIPTNLQKLK